MGFAAFHFTDVSPVFFLWLLVVLLDEVLDDGLFSSYPPPLFIWFLVFRLVLDGLLNNELAVIWHRRAPAYHSLHLAFYRGFRLFVLVDEIDQGKRQHNITFVLQCKFY